MTDLRTALLKIIGDEPAPHEDPYERCRQIAADALGYEAPAPMRHDFTVLNVYPPAPMVELVPHGELMALKERDEARAEVVTLKAEISTLRRRVAERDASIVNAVRTGKAFRHV